MKQSEGYFRVLPWLMALLASVFMAACGGGGGGGDTILGTSNVTAIAPTVTATTPLARTPIVTGVAINSKVTATFSKAMNADTLSASTFTVACPNGTNIAGTVAYVAASRVATFSHATNFPINTTCTATITTGAKDTGGVALAQNFVWQFKTGATADTTRPTVTLTVPAAGATGVATNTKVTATFSEDMDPATITGTSFTLVNTTLGGTAVAGDVSYAVVGKIATFTPTAALPANTLFTATVTTTAADLAGNTLAANKVWTFTTGSASDTTAPTVTLVNPADLATAVCLNKTVNATFSEAMDPLTLTTVNFTLAKTATPGVLVDGVVTYDAATKIASLNPTADLSSSTQYTATVVGGASGVKDLAGNALAVNKVWTFTTGTSTCTTPVALGRAAPFGNLGGTAGTTNQGINTVIDGDLGSTATVTSSVTGFHDSAAPVPDTYTETGSNIGTVNGRIYTCTVSTTGPTSAAVNPASCTTATDARSDALDAYNTLAGLTGGVDPGAGQLGGLTLAPGIYKAAGGTFQITGSDLTLDAGGDVNAVWVFQMASSLTVGAPGAPRSVILSGGAQAKNVFWQVGSSATINGAGGGTMVGTVLAFSAVSFSTAGNATLVTLNGRATALNASVTMTNTVINVPAP